MGDHETGHEETKFNEKVKLIRVEGDDPTRTDKRDKRDPIIVLLLVGETKLNYEAGPPLIRVGLLVLGGVGR